MEHVELRSLCHPSHGDKRIVAYRVEKVSHYKHKRENDYSVNKEARGNSSSVIRRSINAADYLQAMV